MPSSLNKRGLVSALRFPEFRGKSEWSEKELSQVCEVNPFANGLPEMFVYIDLESVEMGQSGRVRTLLPWSGGGLKP